MPETKASGALREVRKLIADDAHALTFQSFGQYRTALLKSVDAALSTAAPEQRSANEDAARWRYCMDWGTKGFAVCYRDESAWVPINTNGPVDAAMQAAAPTAGETL